MRRRSEVIVQPFREGDRLYRIGVHRHESRVPAFDAPTELIELSEVRRPPHRVVRRPLPLPKPLPKPLPIVIRQEEPRSHVLALFVGAGIILIAALIAVL